MKVTTAKEAKNGFEQPLDTVQRSPVSITKNGRVVAVMLPAEHYQHLRGAAWEGLVTTMGAIAEEATASGLTDATLQTLLADES